MTPQIGSLDTDSPVPHRSATKRPGRNRLRRPATKGNIYVAHIFALTPYMRRGLTISGSIPAEQCAGSFVMSGALSTSRSSPFLNPKGVGSRQVPKAARLSRPARNREGV